MFPSSHPPRITPTQWNLTILLHSAFSFIPTPSCTLWWWSWCLLPWLHDRALSWSLRFESSIVPSPRNMMGPWIMSSGSLYSEWAKLVICKPGGEVGAKNQKVCCNVRNFRTLMLRGCWDMTGANICFVAHQKGHILQWFWMSILNLNSCCNCVFRCSLCFFSCCRFVFKMPHLLKKDCCDKRVFYFKT